MFGRKTTGDAATLKRDARKARKFFDHAETAADSRNYDFAIELYISGLKQDPDNLPKHEALHEVGKRRKVAGGKAPGFLDGMKSGGSTPLDKMLYAERLWAMDVINTSYPTQMMTHAVEADSQLEDANLANIAYWCGAIALDLHVQSGKAKKGDKTLRTLRDNFTAIHAWDKALDAHRHLVRLDPTNSALLQELKNLEAENTMQQGGYSTGKQVEEGGFRNFVRDAEKQKALEQDDSVTQLRTRTDEILARRRSEYEEDPADLDRRQKLAQALLAKETDEAENEAIDLLRQSWEESGQYRYKVQMGDVRIKQFNRAGRELRAQIKKDAGDAKLKSKLEDLRKKQLTFELAEFQERVQNYPTDLSLKFELGRRLHAAGELDEAIAMFQLAKQDPRNRALAHQYLGDSYLRKEWLDEAVDTLRQGIASHQVPDDRRMLDLQYLLIEALERSAEKNNDLEQAQEAQKLSSQILQTDINYRDIRERSDKLRKLVEQMRSA